MVMVPGTKKGFLKIWARSDKQWLHNILQKVKVKVMVKVKVKVKVNVKVMVMVVDTQIRFPENLVKIRQAGASEEVILWKLPEGQGQGQGYGQGQGQDHDPGPCSQIRFLENLLKIREAGDLK